MSVAISWANKKQLAKCAYMVGFPISSHTLCVSSFNLSCALFYLVHDICKQHSSLHTVVCRQTSEAELSYHFSIFSIQLTGVISYTTYYTLVIPHSWLVAQVKVN